MKGMKSKLTFKVQNFEYNGFFVKSLNTTAKYTATFKGWTNDPGITACQCSDGKIRLIPSCQLIGSISKLPKQKSKTQIFGQPSES